MKRTNTGKRAMAGVAFLLASGSLLAYAVSNDQPFGPALERAWDASGTFLTQTVPAAVSAVFADSEPMVNFRVARAERGSIVPAVVATGAIEPVTTVIVGTQVSGQVAEVLADYNSEVKEGEVLAVFDRTKFEQDRQQVEGELDFAHANLVVQQAALEKAQADLLRVRAEAMASQAQVEKAQVEMEQAKRELDRKKLLMASGNNSVADRDRAQAAYDATVALVKQASASLNAQNASVAALVAQAKSALGQIETIKATIKQKTAALARARTELEWTVIRAPVNGTVIDREVEVGQVFSASLQSPTLFTVAKDLREMRIKVSVDEADVGRIKEGQKVLFTVDAYPNQTFEGEVVQIRQSPVIVQFVVTYTVVVSAPNPNLILRPGMTTNTRIVLDERHNVLRVPNAALRVRIPGEEMHGPHVWAIVNGAPQAIPVRVGVSDGTFTEIVAGLADNTPIIVGQATAVPTKGPKKKILGAG